MSKFNVGDKVKKVKGYSWPGEVRSVFTTSTGAVRVVVECTVEEVKGALHIYNEDQIELTEPKKNVYVVAFDVPDDSKYYLTEGKLYEVTDGGTEKFFNVVVDDGSEHCFLWKNCPHLNGGNWTRIEI